LNLKRAPFHRRAFHRLIAHEHHIDPANIIAAFRIGRRARFQEANFADKFWIAVARMVRLPMEYVERFMEAYGMLRAIHLGDRHRLPIARPVFSSVLYEYRRENTLRLFRTLRILFTRLERARLFLAEFLFF